MNFYNPYFINPYSTGLSVANKGFLSSLFGKGISFSSIINGTQKTLNIINQTIPVVKQMSPLVKNAKTMFKVMNEFKKVDTPVTPTSKETSKEETEQINSTNNPTFFQ